MAELRAYRADDLEALYRICLLTGDSGQDASDRYADPKIVGNMYAAPYGLYRPQSCLVLEDAEGVGGYIIGAADTPAFEAELEAEWWPKLRQRYADPAAVPYAERTWDQRLARQFHKPQRTPAFITGPYPAHLHIDLLPRFQGRGFGKMLIDRWLALVKSQGARGAHLGVGPANARAVRFYRAYGFRELELPPESAGALIFAIELA